MNKISFINVVDKLLDLNQHHHDIKLYSISTFQNGKTYEHLFSHENDRVNVRSLSKLVVFSCVGILLECPILKRRLNLDTNIFPILENLLQLKSGDYSVGLKRVTIRHLLTQTVGFENSNLLLSKTLKNVDSENIIHLAISEPIYNEPGVHFSYSNASAYILSYLFQNLIGESLYNLAIKKLFHPLNISEHHWLHYGNYCAASTGLFLIPKDLLKIGRLLLQDGIYLGKQVVPINYINELQKPHVQIDTKKYNNCLNPTSYGYFIWRLDNGTYYASGAGGKYIIVDSLNKTVVSIMAETNETNLILNAVKPIFK